MSSPNAECRLRLAALAGLLLCLLCLPAPAAAPDGEGHLAPPAPRMAAPEPGPAALSGPPFTIYDSTVQCPGLTFFQPFPPIIDFFNGDGVTDRNGAPLAAPATFQDSAISPGGQVDLLVFRYVIDSAGPLGAVKLALWTDTSQADNDVGVPFKRLEIAGLLGDETPLDGFPELFEVSVEFAAQEATCENISTGTLLTIPLDPAEAPFWLERGPFGFSVSSAAGSPDFGPVLAEGGSGQIDSLRLLDSFERITLPDTTFFYGGGSCPTTPFAGLYLRLASSLPIPSILYSDDFGDGVVSANYQGLAGGALSEAGGRMTLLSDDSGNDGFAFRFDAPLPGTLCNALLGMDVSGGGPDDFIEISAVAEAAGGAAGTTIPTVTKIKNGAGEPKRLLVFIKDKNGQTQMFTIDDREVDDVRSYWFDKVGENWQFEIRFKDGKKFTSPDIDPQDTPLLGFDLVTTVPEISFDDHATEDAHRTRFGLTDATAVVSDLTAEGADEINVDLLLGTFDFELQDLDPTGLQLVGVDANGNVTGSSPLDAPGNFFEIVDEVLQLGFRNAPLALGGVPAQLLLTGPAPDGSVLEAGTPGVVDPDAVQTMIDRGLLFPDAVDFIVSATGPHIADGIDLATVTIDAVERETGDPALGLAIPVFITEGNAIDPETGEPPLAKELGGGQYQVQYASPLAGLHDVTAVIAERDAVGSTTVEFLPGPGAGLFVDMPSPIGVADGLTPLSVFASVRDENGNILPFDELDYDVISPIPVVVEPTADGEAELRFTSDQHGAFDVVVSETVNGLITNVRVAFPVIAARDPVDGAVGENDEGPTLLTLPVELVVAEAWEATSWNVTLLADTGLTAIGTIVGIADADPTDRFDVAGLVPDTPPCEEALLDVTITARGPSPPGQTEVARFDVLVEPVEGGPMPFGETAGTLLVNSVTSDVEHPQYDTGIPISDETTYDLIIICIIKKWREGCIQYVKADVPDGKTQVTNRQLCATHSLMNRVWKQCCIVFNKFLCDVVISGKINGRDVTGTLPGPSNDPGNAFFKKLNQAAKDAASECDDTDKKCFSFAHVQDYENHGTSRVRMAAGGLNVGQFMTVPKDRRGTRTCPHELGHLLGLEHRNGAVTKPVGNCMRQTGSNDGLQNTMLNAAQCATARMSAMLNDKIKRWYFFFLVPQSEAPQSPDQDEDAVPDGCDNCPEAPNDDQSDVDRDGVGDPCDNCPNDFNPDQADGNGDGIGDACGCAGDTNGDLLVNVDDLVNVVLCWNGSGVDCPEPGANADVNGDGLVNVDDLIDVVLNWGDCPLLNDECAGATQVIVPAGGSVTVSGSTASATIDDRLPFCGTSITAPGVWYAVTGTGNTMTATTCGGFFDYDTKISVYCGGCESPICIGGNDDNCPDGASGLLSTVTWCAQAGARYLILMHGFSSAEGSFQLTLADDGLPCPGAVPCRKAGACGPGQGDCCAPGGNGTPGCEDADCCQAVCDALPFCCDVEWDGACAAQAQELCPRCAGALPQACCFGDGSCQTLLPGDCLNLGGVPQGEGVPCNAVVCPQVCGPGQGDCCAPGGNGTPGCDDPACCKMVCAADPFCCDTEWDGACAAQAQDQCFICQGPQPEACCLPDTSCDVLFPDDCLALNGTPLGPDVSCVPNPCVGGVCGPGNGDCCIDNGSPGCDDVECCKLICGQDPFCCDVTWDGICAGGANEQCSVCQ